MHQLLPLGVPINSDCGQQHPLDLETLTAGSGGIRQPRRATTCLRASIWGTACLTRWDRAAYRLAPAIGHQRRAGEPVALTRTASTSARVGSLRRATSARTSGASRDLRRAGREPRVEGKFLALQYNDLVAANLRSALGSRFVDYRGLASLAVLAPPRYLITAYPPRSFGETSAHEGMQRKRYGRQQALPVDPPDPPELNVVEPQPITSGDGSRTQQRAKSAVVKSMTNQRITL